MKSLTGILALLQVLLIILQGSGAITLSGVTLFTPLFAILIIWLIVVFLITFIVGLASWFDKDDKD